MVKTRFAPSPTGYLHIGGARTALFAWAYARGQGGEFYLRVEDTDSARSNPAHAEAIISALRWLKLDTDAAPVFQSQNRAAHTAAAQRLLDEGKAYYCYATPEELTALREAQLARGESPKYDRRWRDNPAAPPAGVAPAVRFKMPPDGETTFHDAIKGALTVANSELDDFIILRADGAPTYNLAAVADDISMGITHIIRGDDHVMNTYRQWHLFDALAPAMPVFAHLPMILAAVPAPAADGGGVELDADGKTRYARMSKRNAAVDIALYREAGYLPQALCNYLARLSWGHGDAELFERDFFIKHFSLAGVSQAAARFDREKLNWFNREYIRALPPAELRALAQINDDVALAAIELIAARGDTLRDIKDEAAYFEHRPASVPSLPPPLDDEQRAALARLSDCLNDIAQWSADAIKGAIKQTATRDGKPFKAYGMPLRLALSGRTNTPDIAAIAAILGKSETLARIKQSLT